MTNNFRQSFLLLGLLGLGLGNVFAQENSISLDVEAGVQMSDNIARLPGVAPIGSEDDELVYVGGLKFDIDDRTGALTSDIRGSVLRYVYDRGTFDDDTLATIVGQANWSIAPDKFDWLLAVNHGQQTIDPFQAVTPENRENITALSTGPRLTLPVSPRNSFTMDATIADISYEESPIDNQRLSGSVGFRHAISPTSALSVNTSGSRVEYDQDTFNPPVEFYEAFVNYGLESARSTLSIDAGWNQFEREGVEGDGLLFDINLDRKISEHSRLSLNAGTKYSTNGDIFRLIQDIGNEFGGTSDGQSTDDVFRHDFMTVSYSLNRYRTRVGLTASWSKEDYNETDDLNRSLVDYRASIARDLTPNWSVNVGGSYGEREYENQTRSDEDVSFDIGTQFKIGPRTNLALSIRRMERDSDTLQDSYEENRISLTFTYRAIGER